MTGRLLNSFRSGNLAEHLGLLLLKGIAAVAEVARPEDVGVDAVASLLRRDKDGSSYAEDTFVVQLKSASAKTVEYSGHELKWLLGQSQPMFIGLVDLANSSIRLYSTLYVNHAVFAMYSEKVTVRFGKSQLPGVLRGDDKMNWHGDLESSDAAVVWLGEPVLTWTLSDLVDRGQADNSYTVMKSFLAHARRELELISLHQASQLTWSTNDADSIRFESAMLRARKDGLPEIAERCVPYIRALMAHASTNDRESDTLMMSVLALVSQVRLLGVDADPDNIFARLFAASVLREQAAVERKTEEPTK